MEYNTTEQGKINENCTQLNHDERANLLNNRGTSNEDTDEQEIVLDDKNMISKYLSYVSRSRKIVFNNFGVQCHFKHLIIVLMFQTMILDALKIHVEATQRLIVLHVKFPIQLLGTAKSLQKHFKSFQFVKIATSFIIKTMKLSQLVL